LKEVVSWEFAIAIISSLEIINVHNSNLLSVWIYFIIYKPRYRFISGKIEFILNGDECWRRNIRKRLWGCCLKWFLEKNTDTSSGLVVLLSTEWWFKVENTGQSLFLESLSGYLLYSYMTVIIIFFPPHVSNQKSELKPNFRYVVFVNPSQSA
jgi:hypothetical protein